MPKLTDVCSERGFVSAWTITHFASGWIWSTAWIFATSDYVPWLNLLLFAVIAVAWEVVENIPSSRRWIWGWMGYDDLTYPGDSAINAATDVLVSLIAWVTARGIIGTAGRNDLVLGLMLGASALLYAVFFCLLRVERRVQGLDKPADERPALLLKT